MRLLAGLLAGQPFTSVLTGDAQLRRRPMDRVVEPLRLMGAHVGTRPAATAPAHRPRWPPARHRLCACRSPAPRSRARCLLAGLYADGPTTLHEPGPARDHTERMLRGDVGRARVSEQPPAL